MATHGEGKAELSTGARGPRLGDSFNLRVGEEARIDEAQLTVRFTKVGRDSRCPKDVTCIQAGEAVVHLALRSDAGERVDLQLEVPPGGESLPASFGDFRITVLELNPQKESGKTIDPPAYVATVRVIRTQENSSAPHGL